jgi:acetolactate synthase-1/3 small subunit|tara:strand:+ start:7848 stop:8372 length:525 start_codon:yes stop_codon:yes gene_type:complete
MRHIISILLQNEAGALARVSNMFSSRGYNIESLNVAPTNDPIVSRVTLVTSGSEDIIEQIIKQLSKLIDVVNIINMTDGQYIERELAMIKLSSKNYNEENLLKLVSDYKESVGILLDLKIIDNSEKYLTVQIVGGSEDIEKTINYLSKSTDVLSVIRSGSMAIAKGKPILFFSS